MITVRVCATIEAPIDVVWRAVERIETHTEWMQDAVSITFESEQREGAGTAFACLTRIGPLSTTDHFVVTRWEPPTLMAIDHRGAVKGDADFRLRELDAARTEFCWEERLRFPWWLAGTLGEQIGRPVLRHVWSGNVERLKAAVEEQ
ncbi:MAG: SRPBCC family protein [Acidimicrobiia bacterium]